MCSISFFAGFDSCRHKVDAIIHKSVGQIISIGFVNASYWETAIPGWYLVNRDRSGNAEVSYCCSAETSDICYNMSYNI